MRSVQANPAQERFHSATEWLFRPVKTKKRDIGLFIDIYNEKSIQKYVVAIVIILSLLHFIFSHPFVKCK